MKKPRPTRPRPPEDTGEAGPVATVLGALAFAPVNAALTFGAALVIGMAGVLLTTAWLFGPKIVLDRSRYARFSATVDGRIVESWIALDLDRARITASEFWRASAKATPCVVVEFPLSDGGDAPAAWDGPARRAFCGNQLTFNRSYTLADMREMAPGVPLVWAMDDRGFAVVEMRMDEASRAWLASHPAHAFMHSDWPAANELQWLTLEMDQPIDQAIAGWSAPAPVMPLLFDPNAATEPLPAAIVQSRRTASPHWIAVLALGGAGLALWFGSFAVIPPLAFLDLRWRLFVAVIPLLTLPTSVDTFPAFLAPLNAPFTAVVGDMLGDLDPLDRLVDSAPSAALHTGDVRLRWQPGGGAYADTFGRIAFTPPSKRQTPDRALIALSEAVADRVRTWPAKDRIELFAALRRDKARDLRAAGLVFLRAARDAMADADDDVRRSAAAFLHEWFVSPVETPDIHQLGFAGRQALYGELGAVPDAAIARVAARLAGRTAGDTP